MKRKIELSNNLNRLSIAMLFAFMAVFNCFVESAFAGIDDALEDVMESDVTQSESGHAMLVNAFPVGSSGYSILRVSLGQRLYNADEHNTAFHFVLDNSLSMKHYTDQAKVAFSPLVDLATAPCSLTIFSDKAEVMHSKLRKSEVMKNLQLPGQSMTNISAGVQKALEIIMEQEEKQWETGSHHILILLSDGDNNVGHPDIAFPLLKNELQKRAPNVQLSCIVVGVTNESKTQLGMLFKQSFESLKMKTTEPIYYCKTHEEMNAVLDKLKDQLSGLMMDGMVVRLKSSNPEQANFVELMMGGEQEITEVKKYAQKNVWVSVFMDGKPDTVIINNTEYPVTHMPFNEDVVIEAINEQLSSLREKRVAGNDITDDLNVVRVNEFLEALEAQCNEDCLNFEFINLTLQERVQFFSSPARLRIRNLRNQLSNIQNFNSDNSAEQAEFLKGKECKYAKKALRRACTGNDDSDGTRFEKLCEDVKKIGLMLPEALRTDALKQLYLIKKHRGEKVTLDACSAMEQNSIKFKGLLRYALDEKNHKSLLREAKEEDATVVEFLDKKLPALLAEINPEAHSSLSKKTQRQQLAEWAASARDIKAVDEYEMVSTIGMLGLPITFHRSNATQVEPLAARVSEVEYQPMDSCSFECKRRVKQRASLAQQKKLSVAKSSPLNTKINQSLSLAQHRTRGSDKGAVEDILILIDPDCPRASRLAYWSKVISILTSMTVSRDLFMYKTQQRVALHAHTLECLIGDTHQGDEIKGDTHQGDEIKYGKRQRLSQHKQISAEELALRVVYSIRRHWREKLCKGGQYVKHLKQLFDVGCLNEASGIASPTQLLLALSALNWSVAADYAVSNDSGGKEDLDGGWELVDMEDDTDKTRDVTNLLSTKVRLQLYNEVLSRAARKWLRCKTGSPERSVTLECAYTLLRKTLGVTDASAPKPSYWTEKEPTMEEVRASCSRRFSLAAVKMPAAEACNAAMWEQEEDAGVLTAIEKGDALEVYSWVFKELQRARRVVHFAYGLQSEVNKLDSWDQLMEMIEAKVAEPLVNRLVEHMANMPTLAEELQLSQSDLPRVIATMVAQAFMHHTGSEREALSDVRNVETLENAVVELRMSDYRRRRAERDDVMKSSSGEKAYAQVKKMGLEEFAAYIEKKPRTYIEKKSTSEGVVEKEVTTTSAYYPKFNYLEFWGIFRALSENYLNGASMEAKAILTLFLAWRNSCFRDKWEWYNASGRGNEFKHKPRSRPARKLKAKSAQLKNDDLSLLLRQLSVLDREKKSMDKKVEQGSLDHCMESSWQEVEEDMDLKMDLEMVKPGDLLNCEGIDW